MSGYISETLWTAGLFTVYVRIPGFTRLTVARNFGYTRSRLRRDQGKLYVEDWTGRSSKRVLDRDLTIFVRQAAPDVSPYSGASRSAVGEKQKIRIQDFDHWPDLDRLSPVSAIVRSEADAFLLSELL